MVLLMVCRRCGDVWQILAFVSETRVVVVSAYRRPAGGTLIAFWSVCHGLAVAGVRNEFWNVGSREGEIVGGDAGENMGEV